jgi:DNA-binding LacI/PurR family transcriptional regulator
MRITDIARQAHVSPATVSRARNQPEIVSADALARIEAVMREHHYVPAPASRRRGPKTRQPRIHRLGVWFVGAAANNPSLNWFQDQLLQVQASNPRYQVDLKLIFSPSPAEFPRTLTQEKIDGVILQGMEPAPEVLARLRPLPYVWFMTRRSLAFADDYVEPDNEENGRLAARHLHERGHRSVAVISIDPDYTATARRIAAFDAEARALGLTVHRILGRPTPGVSYLEIAPYNREIDALAVATCAATPRATAAYLPVDHFAGALFRAFRGVGLTPGQDLDIILGNYNPVIHHNLDHCPAALDINLPTLVRKVVDQLIWRIENPSARGRVGITVSPTFRPAGP